MRTFYIVLGYRNEVPHHKENQFRHHQTLKSAMEEATRLTKKYNRRHRVLKAIGQVRPSIEWQGALR